ncbi:amidohydrolase family protein [Chitinophaga lutea]
MKIDSHQHFWIFRDMKDPSWINDDMAVLRKDYQPGDVWPEMAAQGIAGCVAVQADQTEEETLYLLQLAEKHDYIRGVVGWIDLRAPDIRERLQFFSAFPKLKGFRHIVQAERDDDFLLRPDFQRGVGMLAEYDFTYDVLIYPRHLPRALRLVERFPGQAFVIDHLAKPFIKRGKIDQWKRDITPFARHSNVCCKIAGLTTEADWRHWRQEDFSAYLAVALDVFGPDRLMFGSDWPVCLPSASYAAVCQIVERAIQSLTAAEKEQIWGGVCARFYHL